MRNFVMALCLSFSILQADIIHAAIFSPVVHCQKENTSADCVIANNSTKVMTCEFVVVGETNQGKLIASTKKEMVMPFEKQRIVIESQKGDRLLHANGEANCHYL